MLETGWKNIPRKEAPAMSRFYGMIDESARRTQPTARAHRSVGVIAASWKGSIRTRIYLKEDGEEWFEVWQKPWHGHGVTKLIAEGRVGE